ncbi:HGxxPAAW family protein [Streptomyces sp. TRM 70361]|uniref:HGxxPAAW family protein n=1 Tax=Streptomyces sp. TRM 70361 TaxID=3116553 RepID=UPI002E7AB9C4|nr:HGxxPAAW family protein [Streptomyces sp. TRM 70361]MEE1941491.1 HGxxPAAW family protein [Streptomyces sp. TRM 70361]
MGSVHGDHDMGHTVAGWTGTAAALVGFTGAGVSLCAAWPPGVVLGSAVVTFGGLVTWALHLMGWGKPSGPRPADQWDWRVKDPMTGHGDCPGCRLAGRTRGRGAAPAAAPAARRIPGVAVPSEGPPAGTGPSVHSAAAG